MHVSGKLCLVCENVYWIGLCRFLMFMLNFIFNLFPFFVVRINMESLSILNNLMPAFAIFTLKHFAFELFLHAFLVLSSNSSPPTPILLFLCMYIYLLMCFQFVSNSFLVSRLCHVFLHSVKHG